MGAVAFADGNPFEVLEGVLQEVVDGELLGFLRDTLHQTHIMLIATEVDDMKSVEVGKIKRVWNKKMLSVKMRG